MPIAFKTILIPVDFSINSDVAIRKAVELVDSECGQLHLLHVQVNSGLATLSSMLGLDRDYINEEEQLQRNRLRQWKDRIEKEMPSINVHYWITNSASVSHSIVKKASQIEADLIVISKNKTHRLLPFLNTVKPCKIARITGKTVFTLKPGAVHNSIKTVVVPVNGNAPFHKMQAIELLHSKYRFKVHLVTFLNDNQRSDDFSSATLVQSFRWIKENIRCPVEYTVLHGQNKAKALLRYAELTGADLMLVDPSVETRIGWLDQQIPDVIPPVSKIQLLLFSPDSNTIKITQ